MRRLALLLCTLLLGTAVVVVGPNPASGSALVNAPLHTSGNKILDASNQPVRLRGLTRATSQTKPLTDYEVGKIRDWGANIVRITVSEDAWNQQCISTTYDPNYRSYISDVVSWVTSRGMVALLDLNVNPRFICDPSANSKQKMADYPGSVQLWQSLARKFGSNPLVAFELYSEPHDISDSIYRNGGTVMDGPIAWQVAGMQQLYWAIRNTGADNLIVVSGTHWASTPPSVRVNGYNVVYAGHVYTCPNQPPPNCTTLTKVGPGGLVWINAPVVNPYDPTPLLDRWNKLAAEQPFVITEFGWPAETDGRYNANVIAAAEQRGWSWLAYAWLGSPTGRFNLLIDTGIDANYDPTPSGVPVKDGLSLNP